MLTCADSHDIQAGIQISDINLKLALCNLSVIYGLSCDIEQFHGSVNITCILQLKVQDT